MKRFVLILLLLPTFVLGYNSPGRPEGFVNDFAHILKPETIAGLNQQLTQFSQQTGNEISVVTVQSLNGEPIETYTEKLFQEWGIGKAREDNGLLLLVAAAEREVRIEVGYGLEPVITDIESGRIIREILVPAFQAGDYDGGIQQAVSRMIVDIEGGIPQDLLNSVQPQLGLGDAMYALLFFLIFFSSILARSKSWWAGGVIGAVMAALVFKTLMATVVLGAIGLIFDFVVSHVYKKSVWRGISPPWWIGGGRGGHSGGFGGFGGGMSGGGGASGRW